MTQKKQLMATFFDSAANPSWTSWRGPARSTAMKRESGVEEPQNASVRPAETNGCWKERQAQRSRKIQPNIQQSLGRSLGRTKALAKLEQRCPELGFKPQSHRFTEPGFCSCYQLLRWTFDDWSLCIFPCRADMSSTRDWKWSNPSRGHRVQGKRHPAF